MGFLRKHWKADPLKLLKWFSASSIMNCTVRDMTNGFSCVFCGSVRHVEMCKRARINTQKRKGSLVLHNIVLNQNDSCTARDVGWAETNRRPAKRRMTQCNYLFILEAERESEGGCLAITHLSVTLTVV